MPRKHCELEILEPDTGVLTKRPLHTHRSGRSSNLFVCYPHVMRTPQEAAEIFRVWCAGTVLTWKDRGDLNAIHTGECKCDNEMFFRILKCRHRIVVGGAVVEE